MSLNTNKMKNSILLCIAILSTLVACKQDYVKEEKQKTSVAKNVSVEAIATLKATEPVIATGRVASKEEITLSFKTGGILRKLNVEEGNRVNRGKQIASLDLQEINAQLATAKFNYDKSARDSERARMLYKDTVGTLENYQNAQTRQDLAKSQYDIAQFNRRYSIIIMPINGKVLERYVEEGELVSPGQPIYKIGSSGSKGAKILRFGLSDKDVIKLNIGDEGIVEFDAFAKAKYPIKVSEITETANPQTGLFEVEVSFKENQPLIKNGFIGNVSVYPSQNNEGLKVPINALVEGSDKKAIIYYTTDNQTVSRKEVELQEIRKDYFLISKTSLPEKGAVVTKGAAYLRDQDSIKVVKN